MADMHAIDASLRQITDRTPLRIRAGGSKDFYAQLLQGELLDVMALTGISSYEPSELVVTVRDFMLGVRLLNGRDDESLMQTKLAPEYRSHARRVLLAGCVQPAMHPNINSVTATGLCRQGRAHQRADPGLEQMARLQSGSMMPISCHIL